MKNKIKVYDQKHTDSWTLYNGDCVEVTKGIPDASIDFSIFSPPFSNLYTYSDSEADMGNSAGDDEFMQHFGYLVPELLRVTVPGRLTAIHCKDLPLYMNRDGAAGLKDFPGMLIRLFEDHGWTYHSRVTIWKDPVIEMERTKNNGLLYKNFRERAEVLRQGMADYIVVLRKWDDSMERTESAKPVKHDPTERMTYYGADAPTAGANPMSKHGAWYDHNLEVWQRYASPVWMDIDQTDVLNYQLAKDGQDEKHICPLQLGVIERSVQLWTNPGDVVLSPFAGIGSEGYVSVKMGRRFVGIELKESYFNWAVRNLREAEQLAKVETLFDVVGQ